MADRTFNSLISRLAISVPGCPYPVIESYIRDAAIEACDNTLAWRYIQPPIRVTPGVVEYAYETPDDTEIQSFLTVTVNNRPMTAVSVEEMQRRFPDWPNYTVENRGTPRFVTQIDVDHFAVAPTPDASQLYDVRMIVALKPLRDAKGMDKTVLDDIEDTVTHGALAALLAIPGKSWTDNRLAMFHEAQYRYKSTRMRAQSNLGAGRVSLSVESRPLA